MDSAEGASLEVVEDFWLILLSVARVEADNVLVSAIEGTEDRTTVLVDGAAGCAGGCAETGARHGAVAVGCVEDEEEEGLLEVGSGVVSSV